MEQGVEMNRNEQNVTAFVAAIGVSRSGARGADLNIKTSIAITGRLLWSEDILQRCDGQ